MKLKLHLTLLLFFLFSYSSQAQYGYGNSVFCFDCDFSIEVGGTLSNINGINASEKAGLYIGLFNSHEFNDHWAIRFGMGYANVGARIKEYNTNVVLHTMIIEPISVHYTFKNKFKTFIGGDLGATISAKNPYDEDEPGMTLFPESIKFFDFSLFFGGGYKLTEKLDINLKYNLGLTNINNSKEEEAKTWKKNYLTLSMGYTFR